MSKFDELNITPAKVTSIKHRLQECVPYYGAFWSDEQGGWCLSGATLPIFTAPMTCVVDDKNYLEFDKNGIIPIIPRTVNFAVRKNLMHQMVWIAVGLDEFAQIIKENKYFSDEVYICVDLANGHMNSLLTLCKKAKRKFGTMLKLMTGNIANPETYVEYAKIGIDYVRCSIGSGGACSTNTITGVGYNPIDLIKKCKYYKDYVSEVNLFQNNYKSIPKIVFDGGCSSIRDIIIALALGADYVMCGKIFAKCEEAAGEVVQKQTFQKNEVLYKEFTPNRIVTQEKLVLTDGRMYYGMSTQRAQKEMGNIKLKHAEGTETWVPIEYKLSDWVSRFDAGICSAMSYCNAKTLDEFIGKVQFNNK